MCFRPGGVFQPLAFPVCLGSCDTSVGVAIAAAGRFKPGRFSPLFGWSCWGDSVDTPFLWKSVRSTTVNILVCRVFCIGIWKPIQLHWLSAHVLILSFPALPLMFLGGCRFWFCLALRRMGAILKMHGRLGCNYGDFDLFFSVDWKKTYCFNHLASWVFTYFTCSCLYKKACQGAHVVNV